MANPSSVFVTLLSVLGGLLPIFLGLATTKFSAKSQKKFSAYAPALSVGILLSTFYDLLQETASLQLGLLELPQVITVILFLIGLLGLQLLQSNPSAKNRAPVGALMVYGWAVGIGLHGLGEGIVIGYGFITGQAVFIDLNQILSFSLHKVGEGITLGTLLALSASESNSWIISGLVAGLPLGVGAALGFLTDSAALSTYAFAVGAGFAAYFIVEFSRLMSRGNRFAYVLVAAGFLFMYFAGLLHQL